MKYPYTGRTLLASQFLSAGVFPVSSISSTTGRQVGPGHHMNNHTLPGSAALWAGSFIATCLPPQEA